MNRKIRKLALSGAVSLSVLTGFSGYSAAEDRATPATQPAAQPAGGNAEAPRDEKERPQIEVCFVLDTTGSMSGLIEGAKQKIWSIANTVIAVRDKPRIKIALIGYRDRGDEYVTRTFDLTDDIDAVFKNLQGFSANGGNDTPESVNQALNEAVTKIAWSDGKDVTKIIFLVGDAPPHMDYADDVKYADSCAAAEKKGIVINSVQCGTIGETTPVWQEIAKLGKGAYIPLAQEGGMVAIATPHDKELAELSARVSGTVVAFGDVERQREVASKVASATTAPAAVAADRAAFYSKEGKEVAYVDGVAEYSLDAGGAGGSGGGGGGGALFAHKAIGGAGDLVFACASGEVRLEDLKEEQLPEFMRKMTPEQRKAFIAEQHKARAELQGKIAELSKKREEYIAAERAKMAAAAAAKPADAFDEKVTAVVREQAEAKK